MQTDLSNQVLARVNGEARGTTRRTLDLGNISTPELGLLSPQRSEIAPRGLGRDAALIAYSERLRQSYRANEGGIRDGMLKLGKAVRERTDDSPYARAFFYLAAELDVIEMPDATEASR